VPLVEELDHLGAVVIEGRVFGEGEPIPGAQQMTVFF
jgi:hypothetical protein